MRRIIYFFYYLKELDREKFSLFLKYTSKETGMPQRLILLDLFSAIFKFNISPLDYFYFRFYKKDAFQRARWAGTGFMYEYQLRMNPKESRSLLENKISFLNHYKPLIKRNFATWTDIRENGGIITHFLDNPSGKLVLKNALGQVGAEVEVIRTSDFNTQSLQQYMQRKKYNLLEEYVIQHPAIMALSSSGLNTVRVFTQLYKGNVECLGARLRITVNSPVDNMAAGNLAAPVDFETGIVKGAGVYSDITKQDDTHHPVSGTKIEGFQIPYWKETMEMARSAALNAGGNLSVGWDIAITEHGPELIEGNHNWCKLLWQLPVKKGLKPMLKKYLN